MSGEGEVSQNINPSPVLLFRQPHQLPYSPNNAAPAREYNNEYNHCSSLKILFERMIFFMV